MIEITIIIMEMMIIIGKETEIIVMMDITVPVQDGKTQRHTYTIVTKIQ